MVTVQIQNHSGLIVLPSPSMSRVSLNAYPPVKEAHRMAD